MHCVSWNLNKGHGHSALIPWVRYHSCWHVFPDSTEDFNCFMYSRRKQLKQSLSFFFFMKKRSTAKIPHCPHRPWMIFGLSMESSGILPPKRGFTNFRDIERAVLSRNSEHLMKALESVPERRLVFAKLQSTFVLDSERKKGFQIHRENIRKYHFQVNFFPRILQPIRKFLPIMGYPQGTDKTVMPFEIVHHQLLSFRGK